MTDPAPEDLEQLARSLAMAPVLGDRDRLDVVTALRRLAEIDKATRRHPSNGRALLISNYPDPGERLIDHPSG